MSDTVLTPRKSTRAPRRALVLILVHVFIAAHVVHWMLTGSTITPVEPSEAVATLTNGVVNAGFVLLTVALLATLLVGRFFCGWACHVVAYQDACAWLLARFGWRPLPIRSRLLVFVPFFAAVDMFVLPPLSRWLDEGPPGGLTWHLTTTDLWERFPGPAMALTTFVVCGFLVVWFFGAKGFCTYGCPYGALFGVVDRFAKGRIRVTDACEGCGHCTVTCTSNVEVKEEVQRFGMVQDPGCMKCMDCVSVCPKGALHFGFGPTPDRQDRKAQRRGRAFDFSWGEEIGMALVFIVSVYAFRNLYETVPFLLAIALALLAAGTAVVLVRLVRAADVRLQHLSLRQSGRFTAAGRATAVLGSTLLLLSAHSAWIQFDTREGARLLELAGGFAAGTVEQMQHLEQSAQHLQRVQRHGLLPTHGVNDRLGQILVHLKRPEEAEVHLVRAIDLLPESRAARVFLIQLLIDRGDTDGACQRLRELHRIDPNDPFVPGTLSTILRQNPQHEGAWALFDELEQQAAAKDDVGR